MGNPAAVATTSLRIGCLRCIAAGGDPSHVEQAKGNIKSALFAYALAPLAPVMPQILAGIVGGPQ